MNEAIETDLAAAMMAIFEEVAAGSQGLIPNWQLISCGAKNPKPGAGAPRDS